jgi:hypothetical protein
MMLLLVLSFSLIYCFVPSNNIVINTIYVIRTLLYYLVSLFMQVLIGIDSFVILFVG